MPGAWKVLKAGLLYFLAAAVVGTMLGTARVLWLAPLVGPRTAELVELPLMLALMAAAAGTITGRLSLSAGVGARLGMGILALALLLLVEFTVVLRLRGQSLAEYFATVDPVGAVAYYSSLAVFALMPLLLSPGRRRA